MSTQHPLVSVIIPVYNGEKHLAECLDSVRHQSYRKLEIIVINDGSTDNTESILRDFAQQDRRIIVTHQTNGGVSSARNAGLEAASGCWVMFVDADDKMCDPHLVQTVVLAGEGDADLICFETSSDEDCSTYDKDSDTTTEQPSDIVERAQEYSIDGTALAEMIAGETLNALWDKAYRRDTITERHCRFRVGTRMGEDLMFNLSYARVGTKVLSLPMVGYFYRRSNADSATSRYLPGKYDDLMEVCDYIHRWAHQFDVEQVRGAADYIRAKNVVSCIRDLHHHDCDLSYQQRLAVAQRYKSLVPSVRVVGVGPKRRLLGEVYNRLGYRSVFQLTRVLARSR